MLTPEDLDKAGELVGSVYSDVEAEMLDYLTAKMIEGDVAGQRSQTAIMLLAQSSTADLHGILDDHGAAIDEAVRREVSGALRKSDADDLAKIKRGLGVDLPAVTNRQTAATVAGVERILGRHNLQMEKAAKDAFIRCSTEAITQVNTGAMTAEQALHRAVRKLEREGVTVIQYQNEATGVKTVANKLDVAVRRHVRTQIAQDGARLTELRMDEAGIEFVEVSSHAGARPSHQDWEGRVYSRNGRKTVDGVTYEDFRTACHWGDVADGIYGANCRHSHGPWIPGTPRTYGKDPKHPSGLDNDEIYQLNQKQREMERGIRATKRELRGCEIEYEKTGSLEAQADAAKLKKKLQGQQSKMRDFIDEANAKGKAPVLQRSPRREWAGDMPRTKVPAVSGRKIDDVLGMPSVAKRIEGAGTSKTATRKALTQALAEDGLAPQSFRWLTTKQQNEYIDAVLSSGARRAETKAKAAAIKTADIKSQQGLAVRDSEKLKAAFGEKRRASVAVAVEEAMQSGDATRANAARVFASTVEGDAKYRRVRNIDRARYVPARREVQVPISEDLPTKTVVHETLHLKDYQGSVLHGSSGQLRTSARQFSSHEFTTGDGYVRVLIREDWDEIEREAAAAGKSAKDYLADAMDAAGLPDDYEGRAFFSDFVDAASGGNVKLGWAHTYADPGYWTKGGGSTIGTECLANYGGSAVANQVEYDLIKRYFPKSTKTLDALLEAMANANA